MTRKDSFILTFNIHFILSAIIEKENIMEGIFITLFIMDSRLKNTTLKEKKKEFGNTERTKDSSMRETHPLKNKSSNFLF